MSKRRRMRWLWKPKCSPNHFYALVELVQRQDHQTLVSYSLIKHLRDWQKTKIDTKLLSSFYQPCYCDSTNFVLEPLKTGEYGHCHHLQKHNCTPENKWLEHRVGKANKFSFRHYHFYIDYKCKLWIFRCSLFQRKNPTGIFEEKTTQVVFCFQMCWWLWTWVIFPLFISIIVFLNCIHRSH